MNPLLCYLFPNFKVVQVFNLEYLGLDTHIRTWWQVPLTWEETRKLQQQLQNYILLWLMLTLPNPCINQYQLFIECTCQQYTMRHMALLNQTYNSIFSTQNIPSRHRVVSQSLTLWCGLKHLNIYAPYFIYMYSYVWEIFLFFPILKGNWPFWRPFCSSCHTCLRWGTSTKSEIFWV